jgi:hypothetical protein
MADRFPYEIYADNGQYKNKDKRRWVRVLENYGASNVKAVFTLLASNPGDAVTFGSTPIPKDFAQYWVSWREGQTAEARQVALVRAARRYVRGPVVWPALTFARMSGRGLLGSAEPSLMQRRADHARA